jgi:hypothetical protein
MLALIRGQNRRAAPQQLSPNVSVSRLARQGVTNAAKVHSKLNQPFFNIIAPGHSAAAINNSPIQQFTH